MPQDKKPAFIFDYIYYRANKLYYKWDGRNGARSTILITATQAVMVNNLLFFVLYHVLGSVELRALIESIKWGFVIGYFALLVFNLRKYKNKYPKFKYYWREESARTRVVKGVLSLIVVIIPWVIMMMMFAAYA